MKPFIIAILLFTQFTFAQTTTYYFIRHAEKIDNSQNPNLSEQGNLRAQKWKNLFQNIQLDVIYSTDFYRTTQTATPISVAKNLKIEIYNPKELEIKNFLKTTKGKKILIVGHSNSTPELVNKIIGENKYSKIDETVFANLYIVIVFKNKIISSQLLVVD